MWILWATLALASDGVVLRSLTWRGAPYTIVEVELDRARVDLYGQRPPGPKTLEAVRAEVAREGRTLIVAMNGGMYHSNRRPVGLHVERGDERAPLVRGASGGNFGLLPNGVFAIDDDGAAIVDTTAWSRPPQELWLATQSGPALVLDGALHPRLDPDSASLNLRNGVGVQDSRHVVFAISETGVRLHDMATLFRDALGCSDALYLDGVVSSLHGPGHELSDETFGRFAAVLAVTVAAEERVDPEDAGRGAERSEPRSTPDLQPFRGTPTPPRRSRRSRSRQEPARRP